MYKNIKSLCLFFFCLTLIPNLISQFYIEGYGGLNLGLSKISQLSVKNIYGVENLDATFNVGTKQLSNKFIGGFRLGLWFDKTGILKFSGPRFLKNLGLYFDLSFNPLDYHHNFNSSKINYYQDQDGPHTGYANLDLLSKGNSTTLAFMLALRATGKFQPYLGIGPGIFFAKQRAKLIIGPHEIDDSNFTINLVNNYTIEQGKKSKTVACLVTDLGLRYMLYKNFSLDSFVRYRFAPCRFYYNNSNTNILTIKHRYHLFGLQVGLSYHF